MELQFSLKTKDKDISFFKVIAIFVVVIGVIICIYLLTKNRYNFMVDFKNEKIEATTTCSNPQNEIDM